MIALKSIQSVAVVSLAAVVAAVRAEYAVRGEQIVANGHVPEVTRVYLVSRGYHRPTATPHEYAYTRRCGNDVVEFMFRCLTTGALRPWGQHVYPCGVTRWFDRVPDGATVTALTGFAAEFAQYPSDVRDDRVDASSQRLDRDGAAVRHEAQA